MVWLEKKSKKMSDRFLIPLLITKNMGYFTQLKTADIAPREAFAPQKERRFLYIWGLIDCYLQGEGDSIAPPAVKRLDDIKYVTVDGHHRLLVADLFKGETRVYVPESKLDIFTEEMLPGVTEFCRNDLNYSISEMFDLADKIYHVKKDLTFSDIRRSEDFMFLKDIDSAKRFHEQWRPKAEKRKQ